jgi:hypothetical protein
MDTEIELLRKKVKTLEELVAAHEQLHAATKEVADAKDQQIKILTNLVGNLTVQKDILEGQVSRKDDFIEELRSRIKALGGKA